MDLVQEDLTHHVNIGQHAYRWRLQLQGFNGILSDHQAMMFIHRFIPTTDPASPLLSQTHKHTHGHTHTHTQVLDSTVMTRVRQHMVHSLQSFLKVKCVMDHELEDGEEVIIGRVRG